MELKAPTWVAAAGLSLMLMGLISIELLRSFSGVALKSSKIISVMLKITFARDVAGYVDSRSGNDQIC